jgi:hypothetical protein
MQFIWTVLAFAALAVAFDAILIGPGKPRPGQNIASTIVIVIGLGALAGGVEALFSLLTTS